MAAANNQPSPTNLSDELDRIFNDLEHGMPYSISGWDDAWPQAKAALQAYIAQHTKEAVEAKDSAYRERDQLVAALSKLFPAWLGYHGDDPNWEDDWRHIVYVELPTGQVSWHIHDSELPNFKHLPYELDKKWDGHTTEEKYKRLAELSAPQQSTSPDGSAE